MSDNQAVSPSQQEAAEPIQNHGGDSATSWEDLDAIGSMPQPSISGDQITTKPAEAKEEVKTEVKEEPKEEAKTEEPKEKADGQEEAKEEKSEKVERVLDKVKQIKIQNGDQEVVLSREVSIPIKIDGKQDTVKLQELLNNYSGKTNWDRKYSELNTDRKRFDEERDELQKSVNQIHKFVTEDGNPRAAIEFIAEAMGADPLEMWRKTLAQVRDKAGETESLTEEEIKVQDLQEELEYRKRKEASQQTKLQETQTAQEMEKRVAEVQAKHKGLDNETFVQIHNQLSKSGQYEADKVTPELVGEIFGDMQTKERVTNVVNNAVPELDDKTNAVDEMFKISIQDPDLTDKQLKQIAMEVYGSESVKRLSQKIKKMEEKTEQVVRNPDKDPLFFDDLNTA